LAIDFQSKDTPSPRSSSPTGDLWTRRSVWASLLGTFVLGSCSTPAPAPLPPTKDPEFPAVVLNGDAPHPTVVRDGKDYYLTYSSFHASPGLPIWHSRNLREWTLITRALRKYVGEVTQPELLKHGDLFYLYFAAKGTVWVTTAKTPAGPWGDPTSLKVEGGGPGHVVAPDGKRFLYLNGGHSVELAANGLSTVGKVAQVLKAFPYPSDWQLPCDCLESAKIIQRNGSYYLLATEGDGSIRPETPKPEPPKQTARRRRGSRRQAVPVEEPKVESPVVVAEPRPIILAARASSPLGPWEPSPANPLLGPPSQAGDWTARGHATIVQTEGDAWYAIYDAVNQKEPELGRQLIVEPIAWTKDGWFGFGSRSSQDFSPRVIRNHALRPDDFTSAELGLQWQLDGDRFLSEYVLKEGALLLPGQAGRTAVLYASASDPSFEISVKLEAAGSADCGLVLYRGTENQGTESFQGVGFQNGRLATYVDGKAQINKDINAPRCRYVKLVLRGNSLSYAYGENGQQWSELPESAALSASAANGLRALRPAVFVRGKTTLTVDDFFYRAIRD